MVAATAALDHRLTLANSGADGRSTDTVGRMRVLYAGSFDPFHEGHLDVVERAARMFDDVVVGVVANPGKAMGSPLDERAAAVTRRVDHLPNVSVVTHAGLTTDLARTLVVDALIRGAVRDHRTELEMAYANEVVGGIPTLFLPGGAETRAVSSTAIRAGVAPRR
jgi:pantetheine-phosphate adenylyltransferase